jgi:hypothetical protein
MRNRVLENDGADAFRMRERHAKSQQALGSSA